MRRLAFALVALTAVAILGYYAVERDARAAGINPDAMNIDMDPSAAPSNTATSLGSREPCARINENDALDADEDAAADTLSVDVTVTNIPASNPMITFNYVVSYDETALSVQAASHDFLLFANGGSILNASDSLPDTDNSGDWSSTVVDTSDYTVIPAESGSGVLSRLSIVSDGGVQAGQYSLVLKEAAIIDPTNSANPPDNAVDTDNDQVPDTVIEDPVTKVAVDEACPVTATPTPTPSPTPPPHLQGDVDCSGAVLATDALKVLRHIAGLSVVQTEPCDNIGTGGPPLQGDVDCSTAVLATDALKILRHIAGLSVVQTEPCDNIGT